MLLLELPDALVQQILELCTLKSLARLALTNADVARSVGKVLTTSIDPWLLKRSAKECFIYPPPICQLCIGTFVRASPIELMDQLQALTMTTDWLQTAGDHLLQLPDDYYGCVPIV